MKIFLLILLGVGGEALLLFLFFSLIPPFVLTDNLRLLDFIVTSAIYLIWVYNLLRPIVRTDSESHKDIGGLGIRWAFTSIYSILALGLITFTVIYSWSNQEEALGFKPQLAIQGTLLLLFLLGLVSAERAKDQVDTVYHEEKFLKNEKADIRDSLREVAFMAEDKTGIPLDVTRKLKQLSDDSRYLSPSLSGDAAMLDRRIRECCDRFILILNQTEINLDTMHPLLDQLERDYQRRRKL